ncbi:DUF934 domain-containing protein [Rhodobacter capsulatus]|uniref:DUF934 domain-containing protein n=1 Tax=Rhodobacter capsulatus TaxID=1061 RepID=UPI0003D36DC7|nr:DUF934 domain-containing protein [Rhodobacter capsulatus]ETD84755.1 hypothetical protein U703_04340 [Rhodobacter capsulatus YW1]ETD88931.1 hypothetical protein U713_11315 [Rhodobacter capsulatus YW2]
MSVIVRDTGFAPEDFTGVAVEVPPTTAPEALAGLIAGAELVKVLFPSFSDGRGFTLGRLIRDAGYTGRLRATGPIIADQYGMARRSGFDEVEIPDALAARQGEAQWRARADWQAHDYRARLFGSPARTVATA